MALARKNNKWGAIDRDGKVVVPFDYEFIHGNAKAGSGLGISERRRNSKGAPNASPTAKPRMLPIARSRWSVTARAYPQVTPTRGLVA